MKKKYYKIILTFSILSLLGLISIYHISFNIKSISYDNKINIYYSWYGASPETLERQVTAPLEGILSTIPGVTNIESRSGYDNGSITLSFLKKFSNDKFRFEVSAKIRQIFPQLPKGIAYSVLSQLPDNSRSANEPLMVIQLNGADEQLSQYAEDFVKGRLLNISDISSIDISGQPNKIWNVTYNNDIREALKLEENKISNIISITGSRTQLGWLNINNEKNLSVSLDFPSSRSTIPNLPLDNINGRIIKLYDIANINKKKISLRSYYRINGLNCVRLIIYSNNKYNQLVLASKVRAELAKIALQLPEKYGLKIDYDASVQVQHDIINTVWQNTLVILTMLIALGLLLKNTRLLIVISIFIIVLLLISALIFYIFRVELTLNSISVITMSIVFAMIYMLFFTNNYLRSKLKISVIYLISLFISSTCLLLIVFFCFTSYQESIKSFSQVFITISLVAIVSTYWLVPTLIDLLGVTYRKKYSIRGLKDIYTSIIYYIIYYRKIVILSMIIIFGLPTFLIPNKIQDDQYGANLFNKIFSSECYLYDIKPWFDNLSGGTLRLFANYVNFKSNNVESKETVLNIKIGLHNQFSIEQLNNIFLRIEKYLSQHNEIDYFITHIPNSQQGQIMVFFKKTFDQPSKPQSIKQSLIRILTQMSGIDWDIYGVGKGFSTRLDESDNPIYNIKLNGYNKEELDKQADRLKELLKKHPRIQNIDVSYGDKNNTYSFILEPDYAFMAVRNIKKSDIYSNARIYDFNNRINIAWPNTNGLTSINIGPDLYPDMWTYKHSMIHATPNIYYKPLEIGNISKIKTSHSIDKINQQYILSMTFSYFGDAYIGDMYVDEIINIYRSDLPLGYSCHVDFYNTYNSRQIKTHEMVFICLAFIFFINTVLFESFSKSFNIICVIPFSFIGLFVSFYFIDINFDEGGVFAFVLLCFLCLKFSLFVFIDYYKFLRFISHPVKAWVFAIMNNIYTISISILLIIITFIPFLFSFNNQKFWSSLALGMTSGVIMFLFVFLFVTPAFLFKRNHERYLLKIDPLCV